MTPFATIHEEAQAEARNIVRGVIDVTPEACTARMARIEVAAYDRRVREAEMALAREIYRRHGLPDESALFQAMNNLLMNCKFESYWTKQLLELITDMDADMNTPEPELPGVDKRGTFDGYTQGVRNV